MFGLACVHKKSTLFAVLTVYFAKLLDIGQIKDGGAFFAFSFAVVVHIVR